VLLPDDIIQPSVSGGPALRQLLEVHDRFGGSVIAVEPCSKEDTAKYGIIRAEQIAPCVYRVLGLVEKPEPCDAPSNLGIVGRYVLSPRVFEVLGVTPPGRNQEVQLTDALERLLKEEEVYACEFEGTRYDTGTPLGWLKATIDFALRRPDLGEELRKYLQGRL
jgi:UTP--glucose-1-phosphate uridylyltransferase